MTDRVHSLLVVLDHDIRTDDVENWVNAIRMMHGVIDVEKNVSEISDHVAYTRARRELENLLYEVLK